MTKTNPRSSEDSLGHRLAARDVRFAGLVAVGLVGGVLVIGALASPMLGWSGSTASVLPEHEQTVRLAEPRAATRRAGVAPGPSEPERRTARRARHRREPRAGRGAAMHRETGLQPAAAARNPAGVAPKPAAGRTRFRSGRAVARPDVRSPRWRLPPRPTGGIPPATQVDAAPTEQPPVAPPPVERPPAEEPPQQAPLEPFAEALPPVSEPAPDRPSAGPPASERPAAEDPVP